jgi:predicted Rossmann fold flavoprotein
MRKGLTAIIGGGAAGICAAISLRRRGEPVIICERMPQLGKKILVTGNGRCNLLNSDLGEAHYNPVARDLVRSIFVKFGKAEIIALFKSLGLEVYSQEGRLFPMTNQASSVLKVLEIELKKLSVPVEFGFNCSGLSFSKSGILVSSEAGQKIECQKVILAGGGKTYPATGSNGSMYEIARQLGHTILEPVPSAVPVVVRDSLCHVLQGQRIFAGVTSIIEGKMGKETKGELLFTKYGLSGTCILDTSDGISIAINRHNKSDIFVSVDMVPFMDREQLKNELIKRTEDKLAAEEMLAGLLPNKLCVALKDVFKDNDIEAAVNSLKHKRFQILGTRGWNEAEFTSGGVNANEVKPGTLESKLRTNVYFAGEILDVNGDRGGYNLGWAWASGFVAGQTY